MIRRVINSTSYFKHLRIWPHCCKGVTDEQGSVEEIPSSGCICCPSKNESRRK